MAAYTDYPIGGTVTLKSGGPKMTIESYEKQAAAHVHAGFTGEHMLKCAWFDNDGDIHERTFWPHMLDGVKDEPAAAPTPPPAPPDPATQRPPLSPVSAKAPQDDSGFTPPANPKPPKQPSRPRDDEDE